MEGNSHNLGPHASMLEGYTMMGTWVVLLASN